jgi:hypothetical protein
MHHSGPKHPENKGFGMDSDKWKGDDRVKEYNERSADLDFEL